MLAIKLRRIGKKHQASYRVVVTEKRSKLQGRFVEDLGWLDPKSKKSELRKERTMHWLKTGAQPTATVHNFLVKLGVLDSAKIPVHKKAKKTEEVKAEAEPAKVSEATPAKSLEPAAETPATPIDTKQAS